MRADLPTGNQLRAAYRNGENVSALLRANDADGRNSPRIIETAYDLQAGSYVRSQRDPKRREFRTLYATEINKVFSALGSPSAVLEAGVGEATTLSYVLQGLGHTVPAIGLDISWSRMSWARRWLNEEGIRHVSLAMAELGHLPLAENAVDIVYTSHSIEPNRGREREILAEMYRVTGRYLVLLEPAYELANEKARERMDLHGYCQNLPGHAEALGMRVVRHEIFPLCANPENPTALTVIEKSKLPQTNNLNWHCPVSGYPLAEKDGFWYSDDSMLAYPILGGVPCLRGEKGIVASQYLDEP